jgi:Fe-S oxidoreductase
MVHIAEFTADLIKHGKLELDPSRNDNKVTFHDSCNPARGMGMLDEPRYVIKTCATTSTKCRPTPSASRPSAAAAVPA